MLRCAKRRWEPTHLCAMLPCVLAPSSKAKTHKFADAHREQEPYGLEAWRSGV